ncbi:GGDEF domain-containing protein [Pelagibacterium montanilacus]|uniref:GGDEF domain-containing protein n=1 Tax=Pelagibacterium montanilacus TaxID=2185280 RepID=UPI000F8D7AFD|nr:hypothetical protein [Pelagibacterium montanilacus]
MSGGLFVLAINLAVGLFFVIGFLAIARLETSNTTAWWLALAFALGVMNPIAELAIAAGFMAKCIWVGGALGYLGALLVGTHALGIRLRTGIDPAALVAFFSVCLANYYFLHEVDRGSFLRHALYQLPYVIGCGLAALPLLRAPKTGLVEHAIIVILLLSAINFLARPILAHVLGGVGVEAQNYAATLYAMLSQSTGAVLSLALGLLLLFLVGSDSLRIALARSERDPSSGTLNLGAFTGQAESRLLAFEEESLDAALILCALERSGTAPFTPTDLTGIARTLGTAFGDPAQVLIGRTGQDRFSLLVGKLDLFGARTIAESVREALASEGRARTCFGIAGREHLESLAEMTQRAHWALAEAERAGGNCVRLAPSAAFIVSRPDTLV